MLDFFFVKLVLSGFKVRIMAPVAVVDHFSYKLAQVTDISSHATVS